MPKPTKEELINDIIERLVDLGFIALKEKAEGDKPESVKARPDDLA